MGTWRNPPAQLGQLPKKDLNDSQSIEQTRFFFISLVVSVSAQGRTRMGKDSKGPNSNSQTSPSQPNRLAFWPSPPMTSIPPKNASGLRRRRHHSVRSLPPLRRSTARSSRPGVESFRAPSPRPEGGGRMGAGEPGKCAS